MDCNEPIRHLGDRREGEGRDIVGDDTLVGAGGRVGESGVGDCGRGVYVGQDEVQAMHDDGGRNRGIEERGMWVGERGRTEPCCFQKKLFPSQTRI